MGGAWTGSEPRTPLEVGALISPTGPSDSPIQAPCCAPTHVQIPLCQPGELLQAEDRCHRSTPRPRRDRLTDDWLIPGAARCPTFAHVPFRPCRTCALLMCGRSRPAQRRGHPLPRRP